MSETARPVLYLSIWKLLITRRPKGWDPVRRNALKYDGLDSGLRRNDGNFEDFRNSLHATCLMAISFLRDADLRAMPGA